MAAAMPGITDRFNRKSAITGTYITDPCYTFINVLLTLYALPTFEAGTSVTIDKIQTGTMNARRRRTFVHFYFTIATRKAWWTSCANISCRVGVREGRTESEEISVDSRHDLGTFLAYSAVLARRKGFLALVNVHFAALAQVPRIALTFVVTTDVRTCSVVFTRRRSTIIHFELTKTTAEASIQTVAGEIINTINTTSAIKTWCFLAVIDINLAIFTTKPQITSARKSSW